MNGRPKEEAPCSQLMANTLRRHGISSLDTLKKVAFQSDDTLPNHSNDSKVSTKEGTVRSGWKVMYEMWVKCPFPNVHTPK
jgi:hypothetical protein